MSIAPEVIDAMIAAGASAEVIAAAWKADLAGQEARLAVKRTKEAERQRRHRESRDVTVTRRDKPPKVSPKNNIQTPSLPPVQVSEAEASSPSPRAWSLPAGVPLQVWQDFKKNRDRKRLPNTETAWKAFLDDLSRVSLQTGIPPPKLIELCTAKGWGAIYDPKDQRNERTDNNPTGTALARVQAAIRGGAAFGGGG